MRQVPAELLEKLRSELDREIAERGGIAVSSDLVLLVARE